MDRQKMLLLFGLAWLSAAALSWFLWANTQGRGVEKKVRVVAAARDLPLGTLLRQGDLKLVDFPERSVPKAAVLLQNDALNRVLLFPVGAGEPLVTSKLSATTSTEGISSTIDAGYRAVSVQITDASGVAGLIQPRSRVDVLFTRPGTMAEAITSTILQNVKVLSIGRPPAVSSSGQTIDPRAPRSPVVTLLLTPEDAQKLELAKNEGKVSLALRNPLDASRSANSGPVTTEVLDPMVSARLLRARRGRTTTEGHADLDDPKVWQELTGERKMTDAQKAAEEARARKAAERPRAVVDVYHGDKHVQELFR